MTNQNPFKTPSEFQPAQKHEFYMYFTAILCAAMMFLGVALLVAILTSVSTMFVLYYFVPDNANTVATVIMASLIGGISLGTGGYAALRSYRNTLQLFQQDP